jgi:hypothetical protein
MPRPPKSDIERKDTTIKFRTSADKKESFERSVKVVFGRKETVSDAFRKFMDSTIQRANEIKKITK